MSNQEKEVLDFLDSLPAQAGAAEGTTGTGEGQTSEKGSDNVFDFLDELEESNKKATLPPAVPKKNKKASFKKTPKTKDTEPVKEVVVETVPTAEPAETPVVVVSEVSAPEAESVDEQQEEGEMSPLNDPITSFTSWWSKSAQSKMVGNFLNQTKQHIQETLHGDENLKDIVENRGKNVVSGLAKNLSKIIVGETSENLRIHINHDIINWKFSSLVDDIFYDVLSSQVQDGVKIIIDEPVFKDTNAQSQTLRTNGIDFQFFNGKLNDGEKLCMANLEDSIKTHKQKEVKKQSLEASEKDKAAGEEEEEEEEAGDEEDSEDDFEGEVSEVFISILPIAIPSVVGDEVSGTKKEDENEMLIVDPQTGGNFSLTFILKDITNNITLLVRSQSFPVLWAKWIMKDEILENIDPGEWVRDWIENGIKLSIQILAQNYVLKRINIV